MTPLLDYPEQYRTIFRWLAFGLGLLAVVATFLSRRFGLVDYRPGGAEFDSIIQPVFAGAFVLALLIALRWEMVGGVLAAFLAATLVAFAVNQLDSGDAAVVVGAFAVPALLWLLIDARDLDRTRSLVGLGATAIAVVGGYLLGQYQYSSIYGPTHPESTVAALPDSAVHWVWSGSVTSGSAEVRARIDDGFTDVGIVLSRDPSLADGQRIEPVDASGYVVGFVLDGLEPATSYYYAVEVDGRVDEVRKGTFTTFPEGPSSFTVVVGSCARVGSNGRVFDTIRELDPDLYMVSGDLHYGNVARNDLERYREVMDLTLSMPAQSALYRSVPIAYMWDDHDYGANDAGGDSASREAAMAAYREFVPSYELSADDSAVYQAFSIGRVRFVLTDARSARDIDNDGDYRSLIGNEQKAFLKKELAESSKTHELVVWLNPVPWVSDDPLLEDNWGSYPEERTEIANFIVDNDVTNLMMVSGDAHMLAIDDGTNTDYSTSGAGGFPLFHAAALDRPGSVKGGPYTTEPVADAGQFGVIEVTDDGGPVTVTVTGMDWEGRTVMSQTFEWGA